MRRNRLRERLAAGEPTLGTHVLSTWPTLIELIGQTGQTNGPASPVVFGRHYVTRRAGARSKPSGAPTAAR